MMRYILLRTSVVIFAFVIASPSRAQSDTIWHFGVGASFLMNGYPSMPSKSWYEDREGTVFYDNMLTQGNGMKWWWINAEISSPHRHSFTIQVNTANYSGKDEEMNWVDPPRVKSEVYQSRIGWFVSSSSRHDARRIHLEAAPGLSLGQRSVRLSRFVDIHSGSTRGKRWSEDDANFMGLQPTLRLGLRQRNFKFGLVMNFNVLGYGWGRREYHKEEIGVASPYMGQVFQEDEDVHYGRWLSPKELNIRGAHFNDVGLYLLILY